MSSEIVSTNNSPLDRLKTMISSESVREQFQNALAENAPLFVASLIDVYGSDKYLQGCNPGLVIAEALKAATLKLPINKQLGFAYIVPYSKSVKTGKTWTKELIPTFQIGYKGYIQLAMRTGAYKYINAGPVYEGELVKTEKLTGEIDLSGEKTSEKVTGFFAYIETLNGFRKTVHGTTKDLEAHGKKFSASYEKKTSPWKTNFEAMATKTMIRQVLGKYGVMSVEMNQAMTTDYDERSHDNRLAGELSVNANTGEIIDIDADEIKPETKDTPGPGF